MGFLFFILIFVFILFLVILNFGVAIIRVLLSGMNPFGKKRTRDEFQSYSNTNNQSSTDDSKSKMSKKVFKQTDGEYVDFEEIKQ